MVCCMVPSVAGSQFKEEAVVDTVLVEHRRGTLQDVLVDLGNSKDANHMAWVGLMHGDA